MLPRSQKDGGKTEASLPFSSSPCISSLPRKARSVGLPNETKLIYMAYTCNIANLLCMHTPKILDLITGPAEAIFEW